MASAAAAPTAAATGAAANSGAAANPPALDFAALLSREYRPARLSHLIPREALRVDKKEDGDEEEDDDDDDDDGSDQEQIPWIEDAEPSHLPRSHREAFRHEEDETNRLVLQLVANTPAFSKRQELVDDAELRAKYMRQPPPREDADEYDEFVNTFSGTKSSMVKPLPASLFHQVELENWEEKIMWEGYQGDKDKSEEKGKEEEKKGEHSSSTTPSENGKFGRKAQFSAESLLQQRRNPYLDNIVFDESTVSWSGSPEDLAAKASQQELILELGVAGRSVARHALPSHRPTPCIKSEAYQQRLEADWKGSNPGEVMSTAELSKGTLHADKEKMERLIAKRQEKRRQMAKDKTNRVTEAMGTLDVLGSGRGRTITSSLMGPGGTERTGRPSRQIGNVSHDQEYVEQLDMVTNHALVRDLSKVTLRQYHRPKLPLAIVRTRLSWQFQIRYTPSSKKAGGPNVENSSSYQAMMMGTHPGAISKAKLRTEADLSPTEGNLVLLEYLEERPLLQMTKGMASKIVTYYRGDKAKCPVSAGGGDRPTRRKRAGEVEKDAAANRNKGDKMDRPPRLVGPNHALTATTITDWVGKPPKKTRDDRNSEKASINVLPEGVTEVLHPKVHGPFMGEIEEGQSLTGLITNLFVAPIFQQEPESTDFLMILGRNTGGSVSGRSDTLGVILRELPTSVFTVGQVEPRTRVYAPGTQGEKNFTGPFISYQIAKALTHAEKREGHGLRFDEIHDRVLPSLGLAPNALRQRLKQVAIYDKNTQIWTTKALGYEDYPGFDALGKQIPPESVAAYEVASATARRLNDLGIQQLFSGSHAVSSVSVAMVYLAGQLNATRELARKVKKMGEMSRSNRNLPGIQVKYYEKAAEVIDTLYKGIRQKSEVSKFIFGELQLAAWHLTGEFIEVHKKGEGTGMMKLTGLGDPSGVGEGFSFLREADSKPSKSVGSGSMQQTAQMKKITGTEDDLRKLTMKQMARILRSYGMAEKQIATLKRWDRVHVIRDLSTKAASDGIGDGLERFARGEKMKLSEQKQMYRDRIQVIWKRQLAALAADSGDGRAGAADGGVGSNDVEDAAARPAQQKKEEGGKDDSDSESEDDDFAAAFEEEMMDRPETNQLVADQARNAGGLGGDASLGQLRSVAQDQDLNKDARELAALKRQREEERAAREGMSSLTPGKKAAMGTTFANRQVIRKRITKTYPDGRQTTKFVFLVQPEEVSKIMTRLNEKGDKEDNKLKKKEYQADDKIIGHSMFEDEDDFEFSVRGRNAGSKRRTGAAARRPRSSTPKSSTSKKKEFQFGKLKSKVTKEQRIKKRKRDEEEAEIYATVSKRKGTSNRKERGSIRERRPHVIMSDRLEAIRATVEARPSAGPFIKPVDRRVLPRYYEIISQPIDLSAIRDRIQKYEYRTADSFLQDFALMKANAIRFNGTGTLLAEESAAMYDFVKEEIDKRRAEFTHLEEAVQEQMSGKPKKKKSKSEGVSASSTAAGPTNVGMVGGVAVNLGELPDNFELDDISSDESINLGL